MVGLLILFSIIAIESTIIIIYYFRFKKINKRKKAKSKLEKWERRL